jgi:hypothetical protein
VSDFSPNLTDLASSGCTAAFLVGQAVWLRRGPSAMGKKKHSQTMNIAYYLISKKSSYTHAFSSCHTKCVWTKKKMYYEYITISISSSFSAACLTTTRGKSCTAAHRRTPLHATTIVKCHRTPKSLPTTADNFPRRCLLHGHLHINVDMPLPLHCCRCPCHQANLSW